jgi:hypothetical protein
MGNNVYIDVIGDGAHGFVADPDNTGNVTCVYEDGWMNTNSTRCRVNGMIVDVTDRPVNDIRKVDGWQIQRTEDGLRARSTGVRLRS